MRTRAKEVRRCDHCTIDRRSPRLPLRPCTSAICVQTATKASVDSPATRVLATLAVAPGLWRTMHSAQPPATTVNPSKIGNNGATPLPRPLSPFGSAQAPSVCQKAPCRPIFLSLCRRELAPCLLFTLRPRYLNKRRVR